MTQVSSTPRHRDTRELVEAVDRLRKALVERAADTNPDTAPELIAADLIRLGREFEEAGVRVIGQCREAGISWVAIGTPLGINDVTALKHYKGRIEAMKRGE